MSGPKFKLPPNLAKAQILSPLNTPQDVTAKLKKLKIAPSELHPVDWRKIMEEAGLELSPPKNQRSCGNCWAMSSTQALTDRFMWKKKIRGLNLAPILTTQCGAPTLNQGCGGGFPSQAGEFFQEHGAVQASKDCPDFSDLCKVSGCENGSGIPNCSALERDCYKSKTIYKALHPRKAENRPTPTLASTDAQTTIFNMKAELQDLNYGGPFVCCYFVFADFMASGGKYYWDKTNGIYINGAYEDVLDKMFSRADFGVPEGVKWGDKQDGAHAVTVVGWDVDYNVPGYGKVEYWIVRNSWGTEWNDGGYFKIAINNDPAGKGLNAKLGFDVPVNLGTQYFGSSTVIDADPATGAPVGTDYSGGENDDNNHGVLKGVGEEDENHTGKKLLFLLLVILLLIGAYMVMNKSD